MYINHKALPNISCMFMISFDELTFLIAICRDWPGFLMTATEAIMENLKEVEEEERQMHIEKSINHA